MASVRPSVCLSRLFGTFYFFSFFSSRFVFFCTTMAQGRSPSRSEENKTIWFRPNGPVGVRCDTLYNVGPDSYIIDFVVTNPSCKTYNTARYKAYQNVNATVLHAQKYKHVHYANCVPPIDPRRIIAFAIDATGRLGPDAKAFLFKTCGTETFRRSKFLKKVSMTCRPNYWIPKLC